MIIYQICPRCGGSGTWSYPRTYDPKNGPEEPMICEVCRGKGKIEFGFIEPGVRGRDVSFKSIKTRIPPISIQDRLGYSGRDKEEA